MSDFETDCVVSWGTLLLTPALNLSVMPLILSVVVTETFLFPSLNLKCT